MTTYKHLARESAAEFIGAFFLTMAFAMGSAAIYVSESYRGFFLPLWMGVSLGVLWYLLKGVSGGHFNPVVTLSMYAMQLRSVVETLAYLTVQLVAAFLAVWVSEYFLGMTLPGLSYTDVRSGFYLEAIGAFLLCFAYTAVQKDKVPQQVEGIVLGAAYAVALSIVLAVSGGIINPAIGLAVDANAMVYIVSPLAGGLIGSAAAMWLYRTHE